MAVRPLKPDEIVGAKRGIIPDAVIEVFNELIVEKFTGGRAVVMQAEAVSRITAKTDRSENEVFDLGWLNIEGLYQEAGWIVEYDKPGFNETYPASFTFRKGRTK